MEEKLKDKILYLHGILNHERAIHATHLEILKELIASGQYGEAIRRIRLWLENLSNISENGPDGVYCEFLKYSVEKLIGGTDDEDKK